MRFTYYLIPYFAVLVGLYAFQSAWLTFLLYHGFILLFLVRKKKLGLIKTLVQGWNWNVGGGLILFGLGGGMMIWLLGPSAGINAELVKPILDRLGLGGISFLYFILYHMLINPWMEEAFWRGHLGDAAKKVVLGDVMFAGYHLFVLTLFMEWMYLVIAFIMLTLAAWLWRQLARRYKGLLVPALSHMAADASIMIMVWILIH